jgi:hypothetical protein
MTAIDERVLKLADAGRSSGGNAEIIPCTFNGGSYVYKRFKPRHLKLVDDTALHRITEWRDALPEETRRHLDEICAWPRRVVRRSGAVTGLLLPLAPAPFMIRRGERLEARSVARLTLLGADLELKEGDDVAVEAAVPAALAAFGRTAQVVLWLHRLGVTVNDVQPENILVDEGGAAIYLVDCDSMMSTYWGAVAPATAPGYINEVLEGDPSPGLDLAKLAWCVHLVLLRDFSLRSIGPATDEAMTRYLPAATVRALGKAVDDTSADPRWTVFWQERSESWLSSAARGMLITDGGWRQVAPDRAGEAKDDFDWLDEQPEGVVLPPSAPQPSPTRVREKAAPPPEKKASAVRYAAIAVLLLLLIVVGVVLLVPH